MALRLRTRFFAPFRTFATAAAEHGHEGGERFWMWLSFLVALPGVALCYFNAQRRMAAEHEHPRAEFVPYSHLRMRTKKFPWADGNHSLFHNPHANALPEGYEE